MTAEVYRRSGKFDPVWLAITAVCGSIAAVMMGVVYSYVVNWIPIAQVSFFATIGLGFGLGGLTGWLSKLGRIRNAAVTVLLGLFLGCVALYTAWAFDLLSRFGFTDAREIALRLQSESTLLFDPWPLSIYIRFFNEEGFWSMRAGQDAVTGWFLAAIWLVEAGFVILVPAVSGTKLATTAPFCEACRTWTEFNPDFLPVASEDEARNIAQELASGDLTGLQSCKVPLNSDSWIQLGYAECLGCDDSNFVTVSEATLTQGKDGKLSTDLKPLIKHMVVSIEQADFLRSEAERMRKSATTQMTAMLAEAEAALEAESNGETPPEGDSESA